MGRSRKPLWMQVHRGFKSHLFRQSGSDVFVESALFVGVLWKVNNPYQNTPVKTTIDTQPPKANSVELVIAITIALC